MYTILILEGCVHGIKPDFLNHAQKFLNVKKCAKIGTIEFKHLKNWAHTDTQRTSQKTILCQNRDLRFTSKGRTGQLGF